MDLAKLQHRDSDTWHWVRPEFRHVESIVDFTVLHDYDEIQGIYQVSESRIAYHLHKIILDDLFQMPKRFVTLAVDRDTDKLLGWAMARRGHYTFWTNEESVMMELCSVDKTLPAMTRTRLCVQMLTRCIDWAKTNHIPIIESNTFRHSHTGFIQLHQYLGFQCRGNVAYLRTTNVP
jgi:hypothetical protein